ncbi:glycine cleavage system aminomethyltransferase GcvT [Epibacterium ulvae]|uniref:glycine cleavage system aminomethyltransferase GcvT n=1 Tax=Epibacterium ulvae TaxID=1156985 RepID=UPI001BFC8760|nr:glycine cleavage system aminomethyltransferase GcvT [Epibacterium ulvae]MBT8155634.1 glycine cleavage system aminomethyltransferase GcvT [Epibacterium ulvae]
MTDAARKTPLYDLHLELGAKMVDFAGWMMPVQYPGGIMAEHAQCRDKAALFDVSHMGQVTLTGDNPAAALETLVPAALTTLPAGKARYTMFTNDAGGILDDLIVSNAVDHLFLVVNASMRDQDIPLMAALPGVDLVEITDHALIALQGPKAESILAPLCPAAATLKFMETTTATLMDTRVRISRLGYTGEDGYEISIPQDKAADICRALLAHEDCAPAGLGARDSLRLEAGLCLYGNEITPETSPIEAGLIWSIQKKRRETGGFPGAARILDEIANGPSRKLVGIQPAGRAPARQGVEIQSDSGTPLGQITSGGFGPTIGGPVAMGYVALDHAAPGTAVNLIIRGKSQPATVVALPFVTQNYKR